MPDLAALLSRLAQAPPDAALVLGSGLSVLAEGMDVLDAWPFAELPMLNLEG